MRRFEDEVNWSVRAQPEIQRSRDHIVLGILLGRLVSFKETGD